MHDLNRSWAVGITGVVIQCAIVSELPNGVRWWEIDSCHVRVSNYLGR